MSDIGILILLVLARILLQVFTNGQYGFHQDELVTLDAAKHLAWGYVAWPPITPFLARVALTLFGPSLIGLITTPFNIQNEETINHRAIYLCHNLRLPWPVLWQHFQYFG